MTKCEADWENFRSHDDQILAIRQKKRKLGFKQNFIFLSINYFDNNVEMLLLS